MRSKLRFLPLLLAIVAACGCPEGHYAAANADSDSDGDPEDTNSEPDPTNADSHPAPANADPSPKNTNANPDPGSANANSEPVGRPKCPRNLEGTLLSHDGELNCPVAVEFQQAGAPGEFSGRIEAGCFFALFEARLVNGELAGTAHFSLVTDDYCGYHAHLTGSVEGSPASRITMSTADFTCATQPPRSGIQLELTRPAP